MNYERFIDEVRMTTKRNALRNDIGVQVRSRLFPKIEAAARKGKSALIYDQSEDIITPASHWVASNWNEVKAYLEREGFDCQYRINTGEYVIKW